jgi:Ca2+-binding RTX toxin-like protein
MWWQGRRPHPWRGFVRRSAYLEGRRGNDTIWGSWYVTSDGPEQSHSDSLRGGFGHDRIHGLRGLDTVTGGSGEDLITATDTHIRKLGCRPDRLSSIGTSADSLVGGGGDDTLNGGGANDRLWGDDGDDSLQGALGDDQLDGGGGTNANDGGQGTDSYIRPDTAAGATNCEP